MDPITQLQQEIERYDADALYYMSRAEHCRNEAALLREELAQERSRKRLEEAHALAAAIFERAGRTGAEMEPAERVMCSQSSSAPEISRLRAIALNHSVSTTKVL